MAVRHDDANRRAEATRRLVPLARRGDADAFGRLVELHEPLLLAVAYAVTSDAATAADAVQDGCLRAWRRAADLRDANAFPAWIGRTVRNAAIDAVRRRTGDVPLDRAAAAVDPAPAEDGSAAEVRRAIDAALAGLDELTRSAVVLRYYQDLPSKQIAELLDLSPAAVDMRLSRGRALLRAALAAHGDPARTTP